MQAEERTRTVIHREWVLDTPAHHTEVTKALAVAGQKHDAEPGRASDIVFTHGDDYLIIGYEIESAAPKPYATTPAAEWDRLAKATREQRDVLAERLALARQALARHPYFDGAHIGDDLGDRITELLVHLRAERDEAQRKAETMSATLKRIRSLAAEWSGITGGEAAAWRNASIILHETLNGPESGR